MTPTSPKLPHHATQKVTPKVTPKVATDVNARVKKIFLQLGKKIHRVVVSPLGADRTPKSWKRIPYTAAFFAELKKGSYRFRLLDEKGKYLATVTYTK